MGSELKTEFLEHTFTFFANCLRAHIANSTLQRHDEFTKNINISCDTSCFSQRIVKKN